MADLDPAARPAYSSAVAERASRFPWVEVSILLLAAVLRFAALDIKPPHFDEGVNGWFADQITRNGYYHYDPTNYHGPLHMYAVYVSQTLLGRNLWALRLPAVLASIACVWLTLRFGRFLGARAARIAAIAMAVSPAYVFFGRYSIHESGMVFFTMLAVWGALALWSSGGRKELYALLAGICGMVLTKETYLIHLVTLGIAGLCLALWGRIVPSTGSFSRAPRAWTARDLAVGAGVSLLLIVFFYSGTLLDWGSLAGLYECFAAWFKTGLHAAGHEKTDFQHGWFNIYWLGLMWRYELPALAGLIAAARFAAPGPAVPRLLSIYGLGLLLAYSFIPYKTPWCIISILWPFLLVFGAGIAELRWKKSAALVATTLIGVSAFVSLRLNFRDFASSKEPYVYVQTFPEIRTLTDPLLSMAAKDPRYRHVSGHILLDSYYPLPWILGDFTKVGYYKKDSPPDAADADFIVVETSRLPELEPTLKDRYIRRTFRLRDAQEECTVLFRAASYGSALGEVPTKP